MGAQLSRHERLARIFERAVSIAPDERTPFLDIACDDDPCLRAEIERLLRSDASDGSRFMPARAVLALVGDAAPGLREGAVIGKYVVHRLIACGGMGAVYEAGQKHPTRVVALKVMRNGLPEGAARRRFEAEAEILGRLHHPGIAQVYEAGTHRGPGGELPFFAMEFVPSARPITEYAREKRLSIRERLVLFAAVCDAVYHGHQHGIIHRDLKPNNILVDAEGNPKVIDFGVARFTDAEVANTMRTGAGELVGTVQYMSPEQCEADPRSLDIRSDVYSLGVILHELLAGRPPYGATAGSILELMRMVREAAPVRLGAVDRSLRGDIETLVAHALEKDRARRYRSAADLADDIHRALAGRPISARPPSAWYQFSRFARRHRVPVAAAALLTLVLVGSVASMTVLYGRQATAITQLRLERRESDALDRFHEQAQGMVRAALDDRLPPGQGLAMAANLAEREFRDEPGLLASALLGIASPPERPASPRDADDARAGRREMLVRDLLVRSADALERDPTFHPRRAKLHTELGRRLLEAGERARADEIAMTGMEIPGLADHQRAALLQLRAEVLDASGLAAEAGHLSRDAFELVRDCTERRGVGALPVLRQRAEFLQRRGDSALETLGLALQIHRDAKLANPLDVAEILDDLADEHLRGGRLTEARTAAEEAYRTRVGFFGDESWTAVRMARQRLDTILARTEGPASSSQIK